MPLNMPDFNLYIDQLNIDFWRELCTKEGELRSYRKGEYLLRQGETTGCVWGFIKQGYFKYSVTDTDGNTHITGFSFCDTPVGDYLNLVMKTPAMTDIIAATDAEVFVCSRSVIKELFGKHPDLHHAVADGLFYQTYDRFLNLYRQSAKERYVHLLEQFPDLLQNITLKELASYLQITPTHLSRIRKEITFGRR